MGDLCYNALQKNSRKCLVQGKDNEMFANLDCVVNLHERSEDMANSCAALTQNDPNRQSPNNKRDLYVVDRSSKTTNKLKNIQTTYQDCCLTKGQPNMYEHKTDYANGTLPKCHMAHMGGAYLNSEINKGTGYASETTRSGNQYRSSSVFHDKQPRYHYNGESVPNAEYNDGCFYGNHGAPMSTQCDMDPKSSQCNVNIKNAAMDKLFVPLNRKDFSYPDRREIFIEVDGKDLQKRFPKPEDNAYNRAHSEYLASVAMEDYNRYNMFGKKDLSENDLSVPSDDSGSILRRPKVLQYLRNQDAGLAAYLNPEDVVAIDKLTLEEKAKLETFIKSDLKGKQTLRAEGHDQSLGEAYERFNTSDYHSLVELFGKDGKAMLQKAKNGYFDEVYDISRRACTVGASEELCKAEKNSADDIIGQINNFKNAKDIQAAAQKSLAEQEKAYIVPKSLDESKDLDSVYNTVSPYDEDTDTIAFMSGSVAPNM